MSRATARKFALAATAALVAVACPGYAEQQPAAQHADMTDHALLARLEGVEQDMDQIIRDWNGVGIGVGVVSNGRLIYARGFGYRDYGRKLPITPKTLFPIASNTKLFTTVAAGLLVHEGKLSWDEPVRRAVPSIKFFSDELDATISVRDMLAHRTGVPRYDAIWMRSDFSSSDVFEKLRYLKPVQPPRTMHIYNNLMYAAVGRMTELKAGMPWQDFIRRRLLDPLGMHDTNFSVPEMLRKPDHALPYTERRDSNEIYLREFSGDIEPVMAAGGMNSSIEDLSHWLVALIDNGRYEGKQVFPRDVLDAALEPALAVSYSPGDGRGWWEELNFIQGMGLMTVSYRGRRLVLHGGDLSGFHSQVSFMPNERLGVIVFVIGDHMRRLYNPITYNIYERLLDLDQTPWSKRQLAVRRAEKMQGTEERAAANQHQARETRPSHPLSAYVGTFDNDAYGPMTIGLEGSGLRLQFHRLKFPLQHFHFDRFDTADDELFGRFSLNFRTNPFGDVDQIAVSLDDAEALFTRRPATVDLRQLEQLTGSYQDRTGFNYRVSLLDGENLSLLESGEAPIRLVPLASNIFRAEHLPDLRFEFTARPASDVMELRRVSPRGIVTLTRKPRRGVDEDVR